MVFIKRSFATCIELLRNVYIKKLNDAAICIQSKFKGHITNKRYLLLKKNIVYFQSSWRGYHHRIKWVKRLRAVMLIQRIFRGRMINVVYKKQRRAALFIQKNYKMWICRRKYEQCKKGLRVMQILARAYRMRVELTKVLQATRLVQRRWRGSVIIRRFNNLREKAARRIQALFRGYLIRRNLRSTVEYLRYLSRRRKHTYALSKFVAKFKMILHRRRYKQIQKATSHIQNWWRTQSLRSAYKVKIKSIFVLQVSAIAFIYICSALVNYYNIRNTCITYRELSGASPPNCI
jgi:hypothetical protein